MTPKDLMKILKKEGFIFIRQSGNHAIFKDANF
ncbi:MAG: type II toxin-antitoxin system HicA family toxin [Candidatus Peregrinibacteria bacterium]